MEPTTNYLADLEKETLVQADKGLRFVNYLIDSILYGVLFFVIGFVYALMAVSQDDEVYIIEESAIPTITLYVIYYLIFVGLYTIIEGVSDGRSLGKLVTNTVAVRKDGKPFTFKDALLRSLCRIIPFEPFFALFMEPWHDSLTNTTVVKRR